MKKLIYLIVAIVAFGLIVAGCIPMVPPSEQNELGSIISKTGEIEEYTENIKNDDHKIRNKWGLKGNFVAYPGYNWSGLAEGATWEYSIHIKEAMNGDYSVGSIRFMTGDIDVVGQVKQTKRDYLKWKGDEGNLAAAGIAEYGGITYNFLFLYAERAMWFALTLDPIDSFWPSQTAMSTRAYQLHSLNTNDYPLDYKLIHGGIIY
jgi:hypothetical protein